MGGAWGTCRVDLNDPSSWILSPSAGECRRPSVSVAPCPQATVFSSHYWIECLVIINIFPASCWLNEISSWLRHYFEKSAKSDGKRGQPQQFFCAASGPPTKRRSSARNETRPQIKWSLFLNINYYCIITGLGKFRLSFVGFGNDYLDVCLTIRLTKLQIVFGICEWNQYHYCCRFKLSVCRENS